MPAAELPPGRLAPRAIAAAASDEVCGLVAWAQWLVEAPSGPGLDLPIARLFHAHSAPSWPDTGPAGAPGAMFAALRTSWCSQRTAERLGEGLPANRPRRGENQAAWPADEATGLLPAVAESTDACHELAAILLSYAALIESGRRELRRLTRVFADACHGMRYGGQTGWHSVPMSAVRAVPSAALTAVRSAAGAVNWPDTLAALVRGAGLSRLPAAEVGGHGWWQPVDSFCQAQSQVLNHVQAELGTLQHRARPLCDRPAPR